MTIETAPFDPAQYLTGPESQAERRRTGGTTAIAILNIVFGGLGVLNGLFHLLGAAVLMFELLRLGVFEIPVARLAFSLLLLATGVVGVIAGVGMLALRPWARALSLGYGGLLILCCGFSFLMVPIIATIGTYNIGSVDAYGLARLILFSALYVVLPVIYSIVLGVVFYTRGWKTAFAKGSRKP